MEFSDSRLRAVRVEVLGMADGSKQKAGTISVLCTNLSQFWCSLRSMGKDGDKA